MISFLSTNLSLLSTGLRAVSVHMEIAFVLAVN